MELNFQEITLAEAPKYVEHWRMCGQLSTDYSFPVIWSLGADYGTQLAYDESTDLYWLHQSKVGLSDLAPVGNWNRGDWGRVLRERYGHEITLSLVPEALADMWSEQLADCAAVHVADDRGTWEYLYDIRQLASLAGNKYMKKRNRVNQFRKNYDYAYMPVTEQLLPEIVDFQYSWCQVNHCGTTMGLMQENHAIQKILQNWYKIPNLCGGAIVLNGKIIAYTIGEMAGTALMVHYERPASSMGRLTRSSTRNSSPIWWMSIPSCRL